MISPGHLRIVMGVDIDETGRNEFAACVDLLIGFWQGAADGGDCSVADRHIRFIQATACAIDDGAAADNKRFGHALLLLPIYWPVSVRLCGRSIFWTGRCEAACGTGTFSAVGPNVVE